MDFDLKQEIRAAFKGILPEICINTLETRFKPLVSEALKNQGCCQQHKNIDLLIVQQLIKFLPHYYDPTRCHWASGINLILPLQTTHPNNLESISQNLKIPKTEILTRSLMLIHVLSNVEPRHYEYYQHGLLHLINQYQRIESHQEELKSKQQQASEAAKKKHSKTNQFKAAVLRDYPINKNRYNSKNHYAESMYNNPAKLGYESCPVEPRTIAKWLSGL